MARAVATALDLGGIPPLNLVFEVVATLPATGLVAGRVVWNTATDAAYIYDGADWGAFGVAGEITAHTHTISEVDGLTSALAGKAAVSHTHVSSEISDFSTVVNGLIGSYISGGAFNEQLDTIAEITTQIAANSDALDALIGAAAKHAADIGDGTATSIAVTHNLNSLDVIVQVYRKSDGAEVITDVVRTGVNVVTIGFAVAPASNAYRVVVRG